MGTRRDTLVAAAMHLFAERGYDGTSVADIQIAAGLTGGSGALYKHFTSKDAVLEAGVDAYLESLAENSSTTVRELPPDLREALQVIASSVIESMTADKAILRVFLRDLGHHPDLVERLWNGVLSNVYTEMADWIRGQVAGGVSSVSDPDAVATVLISALTQWPILYALIEKTPGNFERSAFVSAWVDTAIRVLQTPSVH
ncbi:TetR/AcrR family transcriptional regulator [Saxibacter everestensis]|uniref:TetR/AcrR family transcriptional regulator n=1 Tax=Saxibacter everestensis TaxID=2909229 RepID=A0ABY8QS09_9MICO|nr:TetR/AcrR family transcriptional regulator [Brevibacteriaceae bacterium ZFBP1038]